MNLVTKPLSALTRSEWNTCKKLTNLKNGNMWWMMDEQRGNPNSLVILLKNGRGTVAWALLVPVKDLAPHWEMTRYAKSKCKYNVQLYVNKKYRRRGYGKILMDEAIKYDKHPFVYPHQPKIGLFFSRYGVTTWQEFRWCLAKRGN